MRTSSLLVMFLAASALFASLSGAALAQDAPAPPGTTVALIDIAEVFAHYQPFNDRMDAMKAEVTALEQDLLQKQQQLQALQQQLRAIGGNPGERVALEHQIALQTADLQAQAATKAEEFRTREATVYLESYQEIVAVIEEYTETHEIDLVLRINHNEADPSDPEAVLRLVNSHIVVQRDLDITYDILSILNETAAAPTAVESR